MPVRSLPDLQQVTRAAPSFTAYFWVACSTSACFSALPSLSLTATWASANKASSASQGSAIRHSSATSPAATCASTAASDCW